jgi:hypothetical protein
MVAVPLIIKSIKKITDNYIVTTNITFVLLHGRYYINQTKFKNL